MIDNGVVSVVERVFVWAQRWQADLAEFEGVAHLVRTSLSGARHEIILVHPDRRKSVLIALSDRMSEQDVERVARVLGVEQVPAGAIYSRRRSGSAQARRRWAEDASTPFLGSAQSHLEQIV